MANELSMLELEAELAIELPERPMMRHHRMNKKHNKHHLRHHHHNNEFFRGNDRGDFGGGRVTQQMNNFAFANAVGFGANATAANISVGNTQNFQSFSF